MVLKNLFIPAQYRFFDKAAVITDPSPSDINTRNRWKLCTVTQVEEFKSLLRVLPVCATTIGLALSYSQVSTFFLSQAGLTDRNLGPHFTIPIGSVAIFTALDALIIIPIYQKWMVPLLRKFTGHERGLTSLQRIGVGLFLGIFSFVSAALVEKKRVDSFEEQHKMSVFWLFPQFFLIGSAEVFAYVGQLEFFYDEATDGTRSISSALFLSEFGIGSFLSTALVKIIVRSTGGQETGWLRNDLNKSRLDYFYWIVAGIDIVLFFMFLWIATRYKRRQNGSVADESMLELGGNINANEERR
ncbi:hypothetical protein Patl1_09229 [Pistacia atlantica]|uniref:Uncharacterized protein n=1 Tax=Pistacia atlantica TaxID=434234 RepID=A0ACC1AL20_9ROSI|nr:hypothetical protein Patl1_09229 [Pistacia atlantica]